MAWIDVDKWQEIFSSISRHKLRTTLTALGVFWGMFMLVLLLGAASGLENGVEYEFRDDAINSIWVRNGTTSLPYQGLPEGRRIQFTNAEFDLIKDMPGVEHITGRYYLPGDQTVSYGQTTLSFPVRSVHPGHRYLENTIMVDGRYLNQQDIEERRKVAVIGENLRKELFKEDKKVIGKEINIGGTVYQIVGLYTDTGSEYETRIIYLPISTAQQIYAGTDRVHQIMFTTGDLSFEQTQALEEKVRVALAGQLRFDPADRRAVWANNRAEEHREIKNLLAMIRLFGWIVSLGSILAGIIGVSNIMLIIVKDRTKEIGIRKAMGATPASIIGMVLQEALVITGVAGYLGICAGIFIVAQVSSIESGYFRNPQVDWGVTASALVVLVMAGLLAGWMPARRAANIHPVEAMRG